MVAWRDRLKSRRAQYNGTEAERLRWRERAVGALAILGCGLFVAGCSFQLNSLLSSDESAADQTGSIGRSAQPAKSAGVRPVPETDLAYARAAAASVLAHNAKDVSVPWRNPNTGAGGNITPLSTSYSEGGLPCRDFLASYEHGGSQDWLRGAACRTSEGSWEVRSLKPLQQPS